MVLKRCTPARASFLSFVFLAPHVKAGAFLFTIILKFCVKTCIVYFYILILHKNTKL